MSWNHNRIMLHNSRICTQKSTSGKFKHKKVHGMCTNVDYVDLGDYMQLCFLNSTMPKLKISSTIPIVYPHFPPRF